MRDDEDNDPDSATSYGCLLFMLIMSFSMLAINPTVAAVMTAAAAVFAVSSLVVDQVTTAIGFGLVAVFGTITSLVLWTTGRTRKLAP